MPQLIVAAGAAGGLSVAAAAAAGGAITLGTFAVPFATTIAAGFIGQVLTPFPSPFNPDTSPLQVQTRSTVAPRRYVMGRCMVSGANLPYAEATGSGGEYMHSVITLCQGPVTAIDDVYFDDNIVGTLDGSGNVQDGTFATGSSPLITSWARVRKLLGTDTQVADALLVAESAGNWTANHRGRGVAALVCRFTRNTTLFPGVPNQRAVVRGVAAYDPRDAATRYTTNPALLIRWRLTLAKPDGPGIDASHIDDTTIAAAANLCDERVSVDTYTSPAFGATHATDLLTFASDELRIGTGDGVQCATTGTLPTGLSAGVTYYVIRLDRRRFKLATSYANAIAGTAIDITGNGSGTHTLSHIDQARYTCNGVWDTSQDPRQVITAMLSTMAGVLYYAEGKIKLRGGAWTTPDATPFDASYLAGSVSLQRADDGRESFNGVRGTYVDPLQEFMPTDFPPYQSATYLAQDGGEEQYKDFDLQFVDNPIRAQRLAKIQLERARRGRTLTAVCKLSAYRWALWDTVTVNLPHLQLTGVTFRVVNVKLRFDGQAWVVVMTLREEDAAVWGWTATEATSHTAAPPLVIPNRRAPLAPSTYALASAGQYLQGADGTVVNRIRVTVTAPAEPNLRGFEIQYKRDSESSWTAAPLLVSPDVETFVGPVEDGVDYDFQVRTVTVLGAVSSWVPNAHTVTGKTAAPDAPTSLSVAAAAGGYDAAWTVSPDSDYGRSELWEATSNDRATATLLFSGQGNRYSRTGLTGGVTRWLWARHVDRSGNVSAWFPASATAGVSVVTASSGGGVKTVSNATTITTGTGNPPPGGDDYWAVYSQHDGRLYRWIPSNGGYVRNVNGQDIDAASVLADRIAVANLAAISANLGAINAGSIDIGSGKFSVDGSGNVTIRNAASGARLEVTNSVVRVYDSSGTLRVKLGSLA